MVAIMLADRGARRPFGADRTQDANFWGMRPIPRFSEHPLMRSTFGKTSRLTLAVVMALALSVAAGAPGLTSGPLGGSSIASAGAASYVRVSSLGRPTKATSLSIPRLGIRMPIRQGILGGTITRRYAYHYPFTSWPGGHSNSYFYAHAQSGAFLKLKYARKGDIITLHLTTGRDVKYKVTAAFSVAWNDQRWLRATKSERITLQTCLGNTRTARRFIVLAVPAY
jgi:LPXTG-site transpeptidase (sortase) family protein